jgi:hypothetical protein
MSPVGGSHQAPKTVTSKNRDQIGEMSADEKARIGRVLASMGSDVTPRNGGGVPRDPEGFCDSVHRSGGLD